MAWLNRVVQSDADKKAKEGGKKNEGTFTNDYAGCYDVVDGFPDSWILYFATHNTSKFHLEKEIILETTGYETHWFNGQNVQTSGNPKEMITYATDIGKTSAILLTGTSIHTNWKYSGWRVKPREVTADEMADATLAEGKNRSVRGDFDLRELSRGGVSGVWVINTQPVNDLMITFTLKLVNRQVSHDPSATTDINEEGNLTLDMTVNPGKRKFFMMKVKDLT